MPETVNLHRDVHLALLKNMIAKLEGEDLHEFVRRLTEIRMRGVIGPVDDVLQVAQDIKRIEESLMNFYVV